MVFGRGTRNVDTGKEVVGTGYSGDKLPAEYNGGKMPTEYDDGKIARDDTEGKLSTYDEASSEGSHDPVLNAFDEADVRRVIHKIDRRLIPICGIMYAVSLLDRTNLSNAAIAGMITELKLATKNPDRYSVITLVFFITYVLGQPPTTILTRFFGPRIWLGTITLLWGCTMIGFGFVTEWKQLMGLRLILGILESGFFPGVVYLLSTWYTRYEVGKRYAIFYLIGCLSSAFGGILAFGLMQMSGIRGYKGWRWIFIIEGVMTCFIAFAGYIFLISFPDDTKSRSVRFLTQQERQLIVARVNRDRGDGDIEKFSVKKWAGAGLDWKIWAYGTCFGCATTVSYALAYFLPIILNEGLGYTTGTAQCLIAPPYVFAGIVMFGTNWYGDKYHQRGVGIVFNAMLCIIGLAVMGWAYTDVRARYFGVFLATAGANANVPCVLTYQANNIRGQWQRAFCSATLVAGGALGGIVGSTVFRSVDKPTYVPGLSVAMGSQVIILILVAVLTLSFRRSNKRADRGEEVLKGLASFRYTL